LPFMIHLLSHSDIEYITHIMHINCTRLAMCIDTMSYIMHKAGVCIIYLLWL